MAGCSKPAERWQGPRVWAGMQPWSGEGCPGGLLQCFLPGLPPQQPAPSLHSCTVSQLAWGRGLQTPEGWGRLCSAPWHYLCLGKILSGLALNHIKPSAVPDPGITMVWIVKGEKRKWRCNNRKEVCMFCNTGCGNKMHPVCEGSQPPVVIVAATVSCSGWWLFPQLFVDKGKCGRH